MHFTRKAVASLLAIVTALLAALSLATNPAVAATQQGSSQAAAVAAAQQRSSKAAAAARLKIRHVGTRFVFTDRFDRKLVVDVGHSRKARAAGVESCGGVIAAIGGTVPGWAAAAIAAPFCGQWLGQQNVRYTCWQTRQWWGVGARAFVYALTWGKYTRC